MNIAIYDLKTNQWPEDQGIPSRNLWGLQGQIEFWRTALVSNVEDGHPNAANDLAEFNLYVAVENLEEK